MKVPCPLGDVVDRMTILELKVKRLPEGDPRGHARRELDELLVAWRQFGHPPVDRLPETAVLASINAELWDVEEALRDHEARGDFGPEFVELARSVYKLNDRRADVKAAINAALGSSLVEQKSYVPAPDRGARSDGSGPNKP